MGGNNEFFEFFERNKYLKKLPSMQRVSAAMLADIFSQGKLMKSYFHVAYLIIIQLYVDLFIQFCRTYLNSNNFQMSPLVIKL